MDEITREQANELIKYYENIENKEERDKYFLVSRHEGSQYYDFFRFDNIDELKNEIKCRIVRDSFVIKGKITPVELKIGEEND
jgi:hypothetical protein